MVAKLFEYGRAAASRRCLQAQVYELLPILFKISLAAIIPLMEA